MSASSGSRRSCASTIARYGLAARGEPIKVPEDFKTFTYNKSLECLTVPPKGSPLAGQLIVVTERSLDAQGNHRSYLLDGEQGCALFGRAQRRFRRQRLHHSAARRICCCSSAAYSSARGVAMRIRRIPLAGIKPDMVVDGKPLIVADLAYQIDNMEGIAVHRNARRRNHHHAGVGRQFLGSAAQSAAAIRAGGGISRK